jgi:hypothetical protein
MFRFYSSDTGMYSGNLATMLYFSSPKPSSLGDSSVRFQGDPARKVLPSALFSPQVLGLLVSWLYTNISEALLEASRRRGKTLGRAHYL